MFPRSWFPDGWFPPCYFPKTGAAGAAEEEPTTGICVVDDDDIWGEILEDDFTGDDLFTEAECETVTVTLIEGVDGDEHSITDAIENAAEQSELIVGNGILDQTMKVFHLWSERLPENVVPRKGYFIRDDLNDTYEITRVQIMDVRTRYRCTGMKVVGF